MAASVACNYTFNYIFNRSSNCIASYAFSHSYSARNQCSQQRSAVSTRSSAYGQRLQLRLRGRALAALLPREPLKILESHQIGQLMLAITPIRWCSLCLRFDKKYVRVSASEGELRDVSFRRRYLDCFQSPGFVPCGSRTSVCEGV